MNFAHTILIISRYIKFWLKKKISSESKLELSDGLEAKVKRLSLFLLKDNIATINNIEEPVVSYGYNLSTAFSKAVTDITDEVVMLLDRIKEERKSQLERHRPIILIAYSLGGILVKKAIIIVYKRSSEYRELLSSIKAAIFLRTPHPNVLKVLQLGRGTNASNSPEFANISIRTFCKTKRLLNKDSARLGIVNEIAISIASVNHRSICKFSDFNS
ncbi:hypothetical protein V2W45_1471699 [Cenococcum geophilum]